MSYFIFYIKTIYFTPNVENIFTSSTLVRNLIKTKDFSIYFDAYNANPTSVKAMVYFLNLFNIEHKIPVLGDMMELGKKDMKHHT